MNAQKIAVFTDSGTDTPQAFCQEHDVRVVPLKINFSDGESLRAGIDISSDELIARFAQEIPTTSLPSPDDILTAFTEAQDAGYEYGIFVAISSGLSATCQTAQLVASQIPDFPVLVIDSRSIGVAAGMVVISAVEMIEAGVPFEELYDRLCALAADTKVFFCVKELSYLHKGGRIDEMTYRLGSVLNIKPIIWCDPDGFYRTYKKARGWDRALKQEIGCVAEFAQRWRSVRCAIACTPACEMFDELAPALRESVPNVSEIIHSDISAALVVHTGPELIGMAVQPVWNPEG